MKNYTLLVPALALAAACNLTPGERQDIKTALDVAKLGCVIEHAFMNREALDKVCSILPAEEALVDQALGDLQRHDAAMQKMRGCRE